MASSSAALRVGAVSSQGRREDNQDRMTRFLSPFGEVFAVADGMGGYRGGAQAAEYVVSALGERLQGASAEAGLEAALEAAFSDINAEVHRRGHGGDPDLQGMGSTLVLAVVADHADGPTVRVAHAGDSRAYLLRDGKLYPITRDHSVLEELLSLGVSGEEARQRPDSGHLTRAFGPTRSLRPQLSDVWRLVPGDRLLLCSDGLYGYLDEASLTQLLGADGAPSETAERLVAAALENGSDDNVTAQVIEAAPEPARAAFAWGPPLAVGGGLLLVAAAVAYWAAGAGALGRESAGVATEASSIAAQPVQGQSPPAEPAAAQPAPIEPAPARAAPSAAQPAAQPATQSAPQPAPQSAGGSLRSCDIEIVCRLACDGWQSSAWWREVAKGGPNYRVRNASAGDALPFLQGLDGAYLLHDDDTAEGRSLRNSVETALTRQDLSFGSAGPGLREDGPCRVTLFLPATLQP